METESGWWRTGQGESGSRLQFDLFLLEKSQRLWLGIGSQVQFVDVAVSVSVSDPHEKVSASFLEGNLGGVGGR